MAQKPLVSICTATYKRPHLIHLAIESALNQVYPNWEMIISDDGSQDNTPDVVRRFNDKRIIYINEGHADYYTINRNRAIKRAKGELLAFFDDDSVHHPEFLLEHVIRHQSPDVLITYSGRYAHLNVDPAKVRYSDVPKLKRTAVPLVYYDGFDTANMNGYLDVGDYVIKRSVFTNDFTGFNEHKDLPNYCSDMKLVDEILKRNPLGKMVMINRRLSNNFMWGHDHMTKRKLDARDKGGYGPEEEKWAWT